MRPRISATALAIFSVLCVACGGGPRATTADLAAIRQPTPDPTLDAVVRDLPRALAGVLPPTSTPTAVVLAVPKPAPRVAPPTLTAPPVQRAASPSPKPAKPRS